MPIKAENKARYPKNWAAISLDIRTNRAQNKCEFCGVQNLIYVHKSTRQPCERDAPEAVRIVLTVAHLDHTPENCDYANLKALCQKCHNAYDAPHRKETRAKTKQNAVSEIHQNTEKLKAEIEALHKLIAKAERLFLEFPEDDTISLMISQNRHRIREFEKMLLPSSRTGIKSCSINCDQGDFCEGGKCDINGCYKKS